MSTTQSKASSGKIRVYAYEVFCKYYSATVYATTFEQALQYFGETSTYEPIAVIRQDSRGSVKKLLKIPPAQLNSVVSDETASA